MNLEQEIFRIGKQARSAAYELGRLTTNEKNQMLHSMARKLDASRQEITEANTKDLEAGRDAGLSDALLDRLTLSDARIDGMCKGLQNVAALTDPVGAEISNWTRPNALEIHKIRVPIGVVAIIYESRPNVTADAAALCFKTSNAVILRGGKEAIHSNRAIAHTLLLGGQKANMPTHAVQLVQGTERDAVRHLVQLSEFIDVVIPRGGESLIRAVTEMAHVPVIKHYQGICHTYVDASANLEMAIDIVENAKCQRPGVCNAMETLLIHQQVARNFLSAVVQRLQPRGVELRGDDVARSIEPSLNVATEDDWSEEYLDLILAVRVVPDLDTAISHINTYGSHHSDTIVASDETIQQQFTQRVDSAAVYVNASTRFTDGAEFGMGAEIGISTDKLHARGPMGLEELTTYKYVIHGTGQIRG